MGITVTFFLNFYRCSIAHNIQREYKVFYYAMNETGILLCSVRFPFAMLCSYSAVTWNILRKLSALLLKHVNTLEVSFRCMVNEDIVIFPGAMRNSPNALLIHLHLGVCAFCFYFIDFITFFLCKTNRNWRMFPWV